MLFIDSRPRSSNSYSTLPTAVELTWLQIHSSADKLRVPGPTVRLDRPYSEATGDEPVTIAAAKAGLPPIMFAGLGDMSAASTRTDRSGS